MGGLFLKKSFREKKKMKKHCKKGFTIVELVIVIAVIAILAAVLIPTFVSLVNRANVSADEQNVTNMNTILAVESVDGAPENVDEVRALLEENGYQNFVSNVAGRY